MANGRPRSKSAQTFPVQTELIQRYRLSWQEPSSTSDTEEASATTGGDSWSDVKQHPPLDDRHSLPPIEPHQLALSDANEIGRHVRKPVLPENEPSRMLQSPAGSFQGSTNNDKTPRLHPAEIPNRQFSAISGKDLRQDSAYESATGNSDEDPYVDVDTQAGNIRARGRVELLRGRVLRTRPVISESRQELQLLRENLRTATDKMMRAVDALMTSKEPVSNLGTLAPYYQALRAAQDQLGPAEDAYDLLEMRLNREESELEQEEIHFYTHNNIRLQVPSNLDLDKPLTPLAKPYEPEDTEFSNLDLDNELVKQYLERVSDAEYIKEKLDELESEQYRLTEELSFRTRYNLALSKENSAFLFDFPQVHRELTEKLQKAEEDLYELRELCIADNLFTHSEHVYEPRDALIEEINESVNDARDRSPLRVAAQRTAAHKTYGADYKDKGDYVNAWLFEWIQDSPVETARLKTFIFFQYPPNGDVLEDDKWSELALEFWDKDGAGATTTENSNASKLNIIAGDIGAQGPSTAQRTGYSFNFSDLRTSLGSLTVDADEETRVEAGIVWSETGSYGTQKEASPKTPTTYEPQSKESPSTPTPQRPKSAPPISNALDFSEMPNFTSMEKFIGK